MLGDVVSGLCLVAECSNPSQVVDQVVELRRWDPDHDQAAARNRSVIKWIVDRDIGVVDRTTVARGDGDDIVDGLAHIRRDHRDAGIDDEVPSEVADGCSRCRTASGRRCGSLVSRCFGLPAADREVAAGIEGLLGRRSVELVGRL